MRGGSIIIIILSKQRTLWDNGFSYTPYCSRALLDPHPFAITAVRSTVPFSPLSIKQLQMQVNGSRAVVVTSYKSNLKLIISADELLLTVWFLVITLKAVNIMKTYNFLRQIQEFVDFNYPSLPDDYFMSGVCIL